MSGNELYIYSFYFSLRLFYLAKIFEIYTTLKFKKFN